MIPRSGWRMRTRIWAADLVAAADCLSRSGTALWLGPDLKANEKWQLVYRLVTATQCSTSSPPPHPARSAHFPHDPFWRSRRLSPIVHLSWFRHWSCWRRHQDAVCRPHSSLPGPLPFASRSPSPLNPSSPCCAHCHPYPALANWTSSPRPPRSTPRTMPGHPALSPCCAVSGPIAPSPTPRHLLLDPATGSAPAPVSALLVRLLLLA
jgi:hypothetical protein